MIGASAATSARDLPESAEEYRRHARRLRCRYADHPMRLHRSLRALAASHDAIGRQRSACYSSGARAFAEQVNLAMDGPILRYSRRMALLRQAERAGLGRFEANLVIAAVQHQARNAAAPERPRRRACRVPTVLLVFAVTQASILLGAWWLVAS